MSKSTQIEQILRQHFVSKDDLRTAMMGIYNNGAVVVATHGSILVEIDLSEWSDLSEINHTVPEYEIFPNYRSVLPVPEADKTYRIDIKELYTNPDDILEADTESWVDCPCCRGRGEIRYNCGCEHCDYDHLEDCERCEATGKILKNKKYQSYTDVSVYGVLSRFKSIYLNAVHELFSTLDVQDVDYYQKKPNTALLVESTGIKCLISPVMIDSVSLEYSEYKNVVHTITIAEGEVTV